MFVDRNPIYCGAFWTPISSISYEGITILKPLNSQDSNIVKLELGYPSPNFFGGDDPRNNPDIIKSLMQSGILFIGPSYYVRVRLKMLTWLGMKKYCPKG